jgi:indoleamine 2,3-dioxygenase
MIMRDVHAFGFLTARPIIDVPGYERVTRLARELPEIIAHGSTTLRDDLDRLPLLCVTNMKDHDHMRALMRDYHYLQSAYALAEPKVQKIPFSLAVPSHQLAERLGQKPVLSYASVILENWQLEEGIEFSVDKVRPIRTFTKSRDEVGFLIPHVCIEKCAGRALRELVPLQNDQSEACIENIVRCLCVIKGTLDEMRIMFGWITKMCEPSVYFESIRPWLNVFKDVIFEGVANYDRPQSFIGASGAQSSVMPAIDAALGIRHAQNYFSAYVEKLRTYMPREHVQFIEDIENGPDLRSFVKEKCTKDLTDAYHSCIESVIAFRRAHGAFATRYITAHDAKVRGTGGSVFEEFVAQYIQDTEAAFV